MFCVENVSFLSVVFRRKVNNSEMCLLLSVSDYLRFSVDYVVSRTARGPGDGLWRTYRRINCLVVSTF